MAIKIEDMLPGVKHNGLNSSKDVVFDGGVSLPAGTTIGGSSVSALGTITSTSANALVVGANGATNPVLKVNASTASVATGLTLVGAAEGGAMAATVISSGTDESLTVDAKGAGTISLNATATGGITLGRATTVTTGNVTLTTGNVVLSANGAGVSFTGTSVNGGLLTNLYNTTASALSGTQRDIKILIGTVPYYFTVYPTKA